MVKEMVDVKSKADREKLQFSMMTKQNLNKMEFSIKKLTQDLDKKLDECMKLDQEGKVLKAEREKMK
jgi:septal ring factor EnvC (AmiA/AmiB activator)